jgi:hypothetical protein
LGFVAQMNPGGWTSGNQLNYHTAIIFFYAKWVPIHEVDEKEWIVIRAGLWYLASLTTRWCDRGVSRILEESYTLRLLSRPWCNRHRSTTCHFVIKCCHLNWSGRFPIPDSGRVHDDVFLTKLIIQNYMFPWRETGGDYVNDSPSSFTNFMWGNSLHHRVIQARKSSKLDRIQSDLKTMRIINSTQTDFQKKWLSIGLFHFIWSNPSGPFQ